MSHEFLWAVLRTYVKFIENSAYLKVRRYKFIMDVINIFLGILVFLVLNFTFGKEGVFTYPEARQRTVNFIDIIITFLVYLFDTTGVHAFNLRI